eukprot:scaffold121252_cov36-Tisochrysis_lutea.AAC.2
MAQSELASLVRLWRVYRLARNDSFQTLLRRLVRGVNHADRRCIQQGRVRLESLEDNRRRALSASTRGGRSGREHFAQLSSKACDGIWEKGFEHEERQALAVHPMPADAARAGERWDRSSRVY